MGGADCPDNQGNQGNVWSCKRQSGQCPLSPPMTTTTTATSSECCTACRVLAQAASWCEKQVVGICDNACLYSVLPMWPMDNALMLVYQTVGGTFPSLSQTGKGFLLQFEKPRLGGEEEWLRACVHMRHQGKTRRACVDRSRRARPTS